MFASLTPPALQVERLTGLADLALVNTCYDQHSLQCLTRLRSLKRLEPSFSAALPSCLSLLTQLDSLVVGTDKDEDWDSLAALDSLKQVTLLSLNIPFDEVPPGMAMLPLQRFWVWQHYNDVISLPAGPWLSSLRWTGLPWHMTYGGAKRQRVAAGAAAGVFVLPRPSNHGRGFG